MASLRKKAAIKNKNLGYRPDNICTLTYIFHIEKPLRRPRAWTRVAW